MSGRKTGGDDGRGGRASYRLGSGESLSCRAAGGSPTVPAAPPVDAARERDDDVGGAWAARSERERFEDLACREWRVGMEWGCVWGSIGSSLYGAGWMTRDREVAEDASLLRQVAWCLSEMGRQDKALPKDFGVAA